MNSLMVIVLFVAAANGYHQQQNVQPTAAVYQQQMRTAPVVGIVRSVNEVKDDGSFNYGFESEDGIKVDARGGQRQVGSKAEERGTVQTGSYSYTAPDGTPITVNWVADENGFQATGAHLPVAPPMPDYVVKMLADLRASGALNSQEQSAPMKTRPAYY